MSASKIQDDTYGNTSASKITTGRYSRNEEKLNLAKKSGARVKNMRKASTAAMSESDPTEAADNNEVSTAMSSLTIQESHDTTGTTTNNNEAKDSQATGEQQINTTMGGETNLSSKRSSKKRSLEEISNDEPCDLPLCEQSSKRKRNFDDMKQELGEQIFLSSKRVQSEKGSKPKESHSKYSAAPVQSLMEKLDHSEQVNFEEKPEIMVANDTAPTMQEATENGAPSIETEELREVHELQVQNYSNEESFPDHHDCPLLDNNDTQNQNCNSAHVEVHDL
jgi:hypothetical protein